METTNRLFYSSTKFFTENEEEYRITATVSLDDDCHNNMCDWSITADIRQKNKGTYILFYTKSIFSRFIGTLLNPLTRN